MTKNSKRETIIDEEIDYLVRNPEDYFELF